MLHSHFVIETPKGSTTRFYKDSLTNNFTYRRTGFQPFPAHYGFIETYDKEGNILFTGTEKPDFFLLSNLSFSTGISIKEKDVCKLIKLVCLDKDTNQLDDKLLVILKDQFNNISLKGLISYVDSVISFLICRRSNFVIKKIEFFEETPSFLVKLYEKVDWTNYSLWPSEFKLLDPELTLDKL